MAKFFWQLCENCFQCVHRVILRSFSEKKIAFIILAHWATHFWHWDEDFPARLSEKPAKFLINSGYWAKKIRFLTKKSSRAAETAIYVFIGTVWKKIFLKNLKFFSSFFPQTKRTKVWLFSNFSTGVVGSVFYVSIGTFASKNVFLKNFIYVFNSLPELDRKKFGPPASFFGRCWEHSILRLYICFLRTVLW